MKGNSQIVRVTGIIFVLLFLIKHSYSQETNRTVKEYFFIEPLFQTGKILDIYPGFPERNQAFFGGVNIGRQTTGRRWWNSYYGFPKTGLMISYGYLGNKEVLGSNISVLPNISFKIAGKQNKISLDIFFGMGFSFFNKPYDIIDNTENVVIGSHITNITMLSFNAIYCLSKNIEFDLGFGMQHYSDGHVQIPNVGANIPSLFAGIKYFPEGIAGKYHRPDSIRVFDKNIGFVMRFGTGIHEFASAAVPIGGPKYPVYTITVMLSKRLSPVANLISGLQGNYYTGYYDFIVSNDYYSGNLRLKACKLVAFAGMEMFAGRFGFLLQWGLNLYNPFFKDWKKHNGEDKGLNKVKGFISTKLGAQYYILNQVKTTKLKPFVGLYLNANAFQADFTEIGMGCRF